MLDAAKVAAVRPETPFSCSSARSALLSLPMTVADTAPLCPGTCTEIDVAPATTCAFVTTWPSLVTMMPVPALVPPP